APAERAVERKMMRVQLLETAPAFLAGQKLAKPLYLPVRFVAIRIDMSHMHDPAAQIEGGFDRIRNSAPLFGIDRDAINDYLDVVFAAMVDRWRLVHAVRLAVHAKAHETAAAYLLPNRLVALLPLALDRAHEVELCTLWQGQHFLDYFVRCLGADRDAASRT